MTFRQQKRFEVICDIFPNIGTMGMASWIPDCSSILPTSWAVKPQFDAAPNTEAEFCFSSRQNKLTITALYFSGLNRG